MRHPHHGPTREVLVALEQPRLEERLDEARHGRVAREVGPQRLAAGHGPVVLRAHLDQAADEPRERVPCLAIERRERRLGATGQGAFEPPQCVEGPPGQHLSVSRGVQALEGELEQGESPRRLRRRGDQRIVEGRAGRVAPFVGEARPLGGLAHHLRDLGHVGREQIVLPLVTLERQQLRHFGQAPVEVVAQRGDDPDRTASSEGDDHAGERASLLGGRDPGEELLQLVHQQRETPHGQRVQPVLGLDLDRPRGEAVLDERHRRRRALLKCPHQVGPAPRAPLTLWTGPERLRVRQPRNETLERRGAVPRPEHRAHDEAGRGLGLHAGGSD